MKLNENRRHAVAMAALLALFIALLFLLHGCSWDFSQEAHKSHSTEHHGDFHDGKYCAVCAGEDSVADASAVCTHCGGKPHP